MCWMEGVVTEMKQVCLSEEITETNDKLNEDICSVCSLAR